MKKFIFGFIAIIIIGIIAVSFPKHSDEEDKQVADNEEDSTVEGDWCYIGTLSDKDIYFKADSVWPDNPVINDMVDMTNGYAILRAAYCDAELWFRLGKLSMTRYV